MKEELNQEELNQEEIVSEGEQQAQEDKKEEKKEKSFIGKKKQNAEIEKLQKLNSDIQMELDEQKDKYARLAAEYDNYRKRTAKEIDMRYSDAKADVWKNIITIVDDFERVMQADIPV